MPEDFARSERKQPRLVPEGMDEGRRAKGKAAQDWSNGHAIDFCVSIPLLFTRYYLTVVAGGEKRSATRLAQERRKHPLLTGGNVMFMFVIGTVCVRASPTTDFRIDLDPAFQGWGEEVIDGPVDQVEERPAATLPKQAASLSIAEAKEALAATFGVSPDAVDITIRG